MEKFLKRNILDELYELKGDEFADKILNEMAKQDKELGSLEIEEKLTEKIKKAIPERRLQREVLELLNQYELESGNDDDFWNKMYYKLGVYDCVAMKEVMQMANENDNMKVKNIFLDEFTDDFMDYLESNRTTLRKKEEYREIELKISKIKDNYPNVRTLLEDKEIVDLSSEEIEAVLEILSLQEELNTIEYKETFKLGARNMIIFLKQMKLL